MLFKGLYLSGFALPHGPDSRYFWSRHPRSEQGGRLKDIGVSNAVMVITFLALAGLIFPLNGAISRSDLPAVTRVSGMMLSSLIPLIFFIKRFVKYRFKK